MASFAFASSTPYRRLSLAEIDAVVSARLGTTRVTGNAQPACFNRQVAMYLAKHVAGWSTTLIGRFYHGRDHSTVIHGIQRIGALGDADPEVDALITELKHQLTRTHEDSDDGKIGNARNEILDAPRLSVDELAEAVADRVWHRIEERLRTEKYLFGHCAGGCDEANGRFAK